MMFTSDEVEYDTVEFYQRFRDCLPTIVKVSQGFCGKVEQDTFDQTQIIRLHTISRQKRVAAKAELRGELKYISIPLNYHNMKLCVIDKKGNVGKQKDLAYIVEKERVLPVNVQFPKDKTITFGEVPVGTNHLPNLELRHVFEEIYFLGNFINDGKMALEVIHVPLYLTELRIAFVTGIADQPLKAWDQLQASFSKSARSLQYNKDFGNPEMAEYSSTSFVDTSTDLYSYITPSQYRNFLPLIAGNRFNSSRGSQEHATKDPKQSVDVAKKQASNEITKTKTRNKTTGKFCENVTVHEENDAVLSTGNRRTKELTDSGEHMYEYIYNTDIKTDRAVKTSIVNLGNKQGSDNIGSGSFRPYLPPPIPPRHGFEKPKLEQSKQSKERIPYVNNLPRSRVTPIIKCKETDEQSVHQSVKLIQNELKTKLSTTSKAEITRKAMPAGQFHAKPGQKSTTFGRNQPGTVHANKHHQSNILTNKGIDGDVCKPKVTETKHVPPVNEQGITKLTIDDVSEYLRVLRLEAYIEEFRNQQVDGELLSSLDSDILKYEFGMKGVETARLLNFVTKGHLPK